MPFWKVLFLVLKETELGKFSAFADLAEVFYFSVSILKLEGFTKAVIVTLEWKWLQVFCIFGSCFQEQLTASSWTSFESWQMGLTCIESQAVQLPSWFSHPSYPPEWSSSMFQNTSKPEVADS